MFRDFGRRVQRDLKRVVDFRLKASEDISGGRIKVCSLIIYTKFCLLVFWKSNISRHFSFSIILNEWQ